MNLAGAVNDKVDEAQWQIAQTWEREFWLRQQKSLAKLAKNHIWRLLSSLHIVEKYRGDDDNQWWWDCFDGYKFLPPKADNVIEVGCGPYTNMRLVRNACTPKHLFLSDPLIHTYVEFKMTFVHEMYRKAGCYLDDHPLESIPYKDEFFDLAVMLNVLDHVQDANVCMKSLSRIVKPGGFIVLGQDLTNESDLKSHPDGMRTGHPITLNEEWFGPHLDGKFEPVFKKVLPRGEGRTPTWHYGTFLFAGVKR